MFQNTQYKNLPNMHTIYFDSESGASLEKSNITMFETTSGGIAFGRFFRKDGSDVELFVLYTQPAKQLYVSGLESQIKIPLSEIVWWAEIPVGELEKNYIIVE